MAQMQQKVALESYNWIVLAGISAAVVFIA